MSQPNPSQPSEIQAEPNQASGSSDLPDFEKIEAEFSNNSHMESDAGDCLGSVNAGVLNKEQFYMAFSSVFDFSGLMLQLKSLPIQDYEQQPARAASDAIYDVAEKSPWLRFLIEPSNEWIQRALVVGTFAFGKAMAVNAEIQSRSVSKPKKAANNVPEGMGAFDVSEKS